MHRHPGSLILPVPAVARRAAELAATHGAQTVWFGAAAPLALLGSQLRRTAGSTHLVASTHGHEVGWSMLPAARAALRRIGRTTDVLTAVSRYTRARTAAAFGASAAVELLPPGVDTQRFRPDPAARAELRARYRLGDAPVITCVSRLVRRKGQDVLVRALPLVRRAVPGARLLLVGGGPDGARLRRAAGPGVVFTGPVDDVAAHHAVGDVFAMPGRTLGGGLDVEGLGIVALEAAASGLPVVVGNAGGALETVQEGRTGQVVDGRDVAAVAATLVALLADPGRAHAMGAAGRAWMQESWSWETRAAHLAALLSTR